MKSIFNSATLDYLIISYLVISIVSIAESTKFSGFACSTGFPPPSTQFIANRDSLLTSLLSQTPSTGFFNASDGETPNRVYALAICRVDVTSKMCHDCLQNATDRIAEKCSNGGEGMAWYDYCLVRYKGNDFFGVIDTSDQQVQNYTFRKEYPGVDARDLIGGLAETAMTRKKLFATGEKKVVNDSETRYGLVQCTRDLSGADCGKCLTELMGGYEACCKDLKEWQIVGGSCNIVYDYQSFYSHVPEESSPPLPSPPPPAPSSPPVLPPDQGKSTAPPRLHVNVTDIVLSPPNDQGQTPRRASIPQWTIIVIVSVLVAGLAVLCLGICYKRKQNKLKEDKEKNAQQDRSQALLPSDSSINISNEMNGANTHALSLVEVQAQDPCMYEFMMIETATNNWSDENKLGKGGFGHVFKGTLDGELIAVKRLSKTSLQGKREFETEVKTIASFQHKNLARLLGYCIHGEEKLLIYEFMPNKSLDDLLFDSSKSAILDWGRRHNIIEGIAKGLRYIHEESRFNYVHRDLKPGNVLLDKDYNPKISDFGMAKLILGDEKQSSTESWGTPGYMAPEYARRRETSTKCDVYSFGVSMLEIVSGKRNTSVNQDNSKDLLEYAWKLWCKKESSKLIDSSLDATCITTNLTERCICIGLLCVQPEPADRPDMKDVTRWLQSVSEDLPAPKEPAVTSTTSGSSTARNYSSMIAQK